MLLHVLKKEAQSGKKPIVTFSLSTNSLAVFP